MNKNAILYINMHHMQGEKNEKLSLLKNGSKFEGAIANKSHQLMQ